MYIFGTVVCLVCALLFGLDGNIPAIIGFGMGAIGGVCAHTEANQRINLENNIKTLSGWNS